MMLASMSASSYWPAQNSYLPNAAVQNLAPSQASLTTETGVFGSRTGLLVECLEVCGGNKLYGHVELGGAKNSALAVLAGALCSEGELNLKMIPDLRDTQRMVQVLQSLGVRVKRSTSGLTVDAREISSVEPCSELVGKLRASFFVIGALLGRKGEAVVPFPGGCDIGARPIDLHLRGLQALGAHVEIRQGKVYASVPNGKRLVGGKFHLDFPSVGATETLMMAATLAEGETVLSNVAQEPEVVDLAQFLISCGAKIRGCGTSTLIIQGVEKLHSTEYTIIPDRIEAGTFLIAAAITRSSISMSPVLPQHMAAVTQKLEEMGCKIRQTRLDSLVISPSKFLSCTNVTTRPYPGFPTDLQPQFMTLMTSCSGRCVVEETVFEGRMRHEELRKLGAKVMVNDNAAVVYGRDQGSCLRGVSVTASDLRAGAALVLAGLAADGTTRVEGVNHIDRGYETFDQKLKLLGARVERLTSVPVEFISL